jgi:hypothetical protein
MKTKYSNRLLFEFRPSICDFMASTRQELALKKLLTDTGAIYSVDLRRWPTISAMRIPRLIPLSDDLKGPLQIVRVGQHSIRMAPIG